MPGTLSMTRDRTFEKDHVPNWMFQRRARAEKEELERESFLGACYGQRKIGQCHHRHGWSKME